MNRTYKHYLPYLILPVLTYWSSSAYGLVMTAGLLPYDEMALKGLMVSNLVVFSPAAVVLVSLIYGLRIGFSLGLPVLLALLYLPYVAFIYLTTNSVGIEVYVLIYGVLSLLAVSLGAGLRLLWKKYSQ